MSHSSKIGRLHGNALKGGLLDFFAVADLATKDEKRKQMLARVQEIYDSSADRQRATKNEVFGDPDHHAQVKCVELAARLMNLFAEDKSDEGNEVDMHKIAEAFRSLGWKCEPPKAA